MEKKSDNNIPTSPNNWEDLKNNRTTKSSWEYKNNKCRDSPVSSNMVDQQCGLTLLLKQKIPDKIFLNIFSNAFIHWEESKIYAGQKLNEDRNRER